MATDRPPVRPARRRFLVASLAAAGAVVAGLGLAGFGLLRRGTPRAGLKLLGEAEARTVEAMAAAWFPAHDGLPEGSTLAVAAHVDAYLAGLPEAPARGTVALLRAIERAGLTRFSDRSADDRLDALDAWENSSLYARRMGFLPLKLAIGMAYFDDAQVRETIGFSACPAPSAPVTEWL